MDVDEGINQSQEIVDVEEYRRQYEEMLEQEQPAGWGGAPGLMAEDDVSSSAEVIRDRTAEAETRAAALQDLGPEINNDPELIDLTLAILQDGSEPVELRRAALTVLQQLRFSSRILNARRAEYLAALRSVMEDPDAELREEALETLAQEKDEYAQRRLVEGLNNPELALVPPEKAIQLMGYDVHAEHFPILREIVRSSENPLAKEEAVRLLSADPSSTVLLAEVFQNKEEDLEVRRKSAIALQSLAPAEFEEEAKLVILDESEDDGLRASCVSALSHFGNRAALMQDDDFNQRLDGMQGSSQLLDHAIQGYKANQDLE